MDFPMGGCTDKPYFPINFIQNLILTMIFNKHQLKYSIINYCNKSNKINFKIIIFKLFE
jgi:hypothetical protein